MRLQHLLFAIILTTICVGCVDEARENSMESDHYYTGSFDVGETKIPFRFYFKDTSLTLVNAEEQIYMLFLSARADTILFGFPQYNGQLELYTSENKQLTGTWVPAESSGKPSLPFTALPAVFQQPPELNRDSTYELAVDFYTNDSSNTFPAIVKLAVRDQELTGTFLTETGDFRFMSGKIAGGQIWLSTFDGDHLYFTTADWEGDIIGNGLFYSGVKPPYYWSGDQSSKTNKHLAPADSITTIVEDTEGFSFSARTFSGDTVQFDSATYKNCVTVVSIFGSWCPNCHDELRMLAGISQELNNPHLRFVPIAFERGTNLSLAEESVKKATSYTGFDHQVYYGGEANKGVAATVFPQLNKIVAFPTSVFIDKTGRVRKIHTGFCGPGTGSDYDAHRQSVTDLLQMLLQE